MTIFIETIAQLNALKGPQSSATIAKFAAAERDQIIATGHPSSAVTLVDGHRDDSLSSVRPDSRIEFDFSYTQEIAEAVYGQLVQMSPYREKRAGSNPPTHYRDEHKMLFNGSEVSEPPREFGPGDTLIFVNIQPYARKVERGFSMQAPHGLYEQVARLMNERYGNAAKIEFAYINLPGLGPNGPATRRGGARAHAHDDSFPSITVTGFAS